MGKGVLVTPTADGNILVGPSADDDQDKTNTATTRNGQEAITVTAEKTIPNITPRTNITIIFRLLTFANVFLFSQCFQ